VKVSIVIVSYNTVELLQICLRSIAEHTKIPHEVIVVDNNSTDDSATRIEEDFPVVTVFRNETNLGFSKASNLGARSCHGDHVLFLNPDVEVKAGTVDVLVSWLENHEGTGIVGPRLVFPDGQFQLSAGNLPGLWQEWKDRRLYGRMRAGDGRFHERVASRFRDAQAVGWVTGACLLIRRPLFEAVGGFDEKFFMYFEDKDLCKRAASMGAEVVFCPEAEAVHHLAGASMDDAGALRRVYQTSHREYYRKHLGWFSNLLLSAYLAVHS
jgi:N-acetylglucosaminyl-diphospho-decaprenol L-rhamnosyltransferase